ncbi:MAG: alpha/beta fold hydrolase [Armatimonadota bacterium]
MKTIPFAVVCMLLTGAVIGEPAAQPVKDVQEECSFTKTISIQVQANYLLSLPRDYNKDKKTRWPLVLFLHGAGERGDDVKKVKLLGPPRMVADGREFPFILVSPQCPEDSWWDTQTDMLSALLDEIETKYRVDKDRIYVTGLSMGGFGTWALAVKEPERFAAIAPICGAGNPKKAALIKNLPMWVFHGDKDDVVNIENSQKMVDAVKAAGGEPKFTIYPGVGHNAWTATYNNDEFWSWLLAQRRK